MRRELRQEVAAALAASALVASGDWSLSDDSRDQQEPGTIQVSITDDEPSDKYERQLDGGGVLDVTVEVAVVGETQDDFDDAVDAVREAVLGGVKGLSYGGTLFAPLENTNLRVVASFMALRPSVIES